MARVMDCSRGLKTMIDSGSLRAITNLSRMDVCKSLSMPMRP